MTKYLLLSIALTAGSMAWAQNADNSAENFEYGTIFNGAYVNQISPNGKWLSGAIYNMASVVDVENRTIYVNYGQIGLGMGNSVSDNGIVATDLDYMAGKPGYFKDGGWHNLNSNGKGGFVNGITPDGSMLIGFIGTEFGQGDEGIAYVPVVWHATGSDNPSKAFASPEVLPYPEKDFSGRPPQMISTSAISDDGNIILGQIRDYFGLVAQPIVWTRNADGEWTYKLYFSEMLNPAGVVFPEWPGECPEGPDYMDYMSEQDAIDYDEALNEWMNEGYIPENWPDPVDYMTAEQARAYEEDLARYYEVLEEWNAKFDEFNNAYWDCRENPDFKCIMINSCVMNPQGTMFTADWAHDPTIQEGNWKVTIPDGKIESIDLDFFVSQILADGTLVGCIIGDPLTATPDVAYVWPSGMEQMPLYDYFELTNPEIAEWMDLNMMHDAGIGENLYSGYPCATRGLETIATGVYNTWGEIDDEGTLLEGSEAYSYLFKPKHNVGIDTILKDCIKIRIENGSIMTEGNVKSLQIYNMEGMMVFSAENPASTTNPCLESGIYVIKAISDNDVKTVMKARI